MEVLIANLTSGGLSGGYRKYLQKIVSLLYANNNITHIDIFVPPHTTDLKTCGENPWLSWPDRDHKKGFPWLKAKIRETSPDVVFIPTARWIDCGKTPVVTMIRNMEPLTVPLGGNPWKEVIKNVGRAHVAKRSCQRAVRVIGVSQYVKDFLRTKWNIGSDKIGVVYHGVETPPVPDELPVPACIQNYKHEQLVFTAGSVRPARGLDDLIHAFSILHTNGFNCKIVIAGGADPVMESYKHKLEKVSLKLGVASQIIWAGPLSTEEMSWCYYNCTAFVMTSRSEACPNIVLEAMAHGCVCVSTETLPMPEFFNDAAVYYPPKDSKALAAKIQTVLSWDDNQRKAMSEKAKKRAAEFSWDVCAEKTVAELAKTIESGRSGKL